MICSVESQQGKGALFYFTARFRSVLADQRANTKAKANLQGLKVLVIDGSKESRDIIQSYLIAWGIRNESAAEPCEAEAILRRELAAENAYDVVVVDVGGPERSGLTFARTIKADSALKQTKVILITPNDNPGEEEETGVDAWLRKPLKQAPLFDCIATVLNRLEPDSEIVTSAGMTEDTSTRAMKPSIASTSILLAEDNRANQILAVMLINKLGYQVEVANNGREAVDAQRLDSYDLILMDCQMPDMDGFEAARQIREEETGSTRRVPIIAMTANAMQGDREKCLAAGMDDYITKPINPKQLKQILEQWTSK